MTEPTFELNEPGHYTVKTVEENDFLNDKLETNQYGKWYTVRFEGDAQTYLWMTKSEPIPDEQYFGQLEKTSSGKSVKFKKLKEEDIQSPQKEQDSEYWDGRNNAIKAQFAIKAAVELLKNPETDVAEDTIEHWARIFYLMVDRIVAPVDNAPQSGYAKEEDAMPANFLK